MIPGEIIVADGDIDLNKNRQSIEINVLNNGDRPIQVGSHYHFFEVNDALMFDRLETKGFRLDIASGTAVRFEPGQSRTVILIRFGGSQNIYGFQEKVMGEVK